MKRAALTKKFGALVDRTRKIAWALFLVCLPITSFPFFPQEMGGVALVRPLSLYPLLVLLVIATLPYLFSRPVPRTLLTLVPFALIALASSILSTQQGIEPALGVSVLSRMLRALITLGIGAAIYFTVTLLPHSLEDLRSALRWLYLGFILALLWGSLQAVYVVNFSPPYFQFLKELQAYISTRTLFTNRISGMTYEPNWFAEQISVLLLPWLFGSVLSGYSVYRWRWRWLTVEWFLLIWSVVMLVFTFSRAGLMNLIGLVVISLLFLRPHRVSMSIKTLSPWRRWLRRALEICAVIAILAGVMLTASTKNPYFARLWGYWNEVKGGSLRDYFEYLGFGPRLMYAEAAYTTYEAHPVLGVGLGNYAFFVKETLPYRPLAPSPEILRILTPDIGRNRLVTAKNFYLRILAETGLVGAAAFLAFLCAILGCVLFLWYSVERNQNFLGKAGILAMVAFAIAAISYDSFAIPNMWVNFGLISAAAVIVANTESPKSQPVENTL